MTKTWLITGASSGLGRTMTERLLERGDRVVATVRRGNALDELAEHHGEALRVLLLDVSDPAAVRVTVDRAFGETGHIDVVVSNAGYGAFGAAEELTDEQIDRQIATNLVGSIQLIRASLPHLRAQGGGRVLQLSSAGGQVAYPNFSLYHATKWGIEGFVEAIAQEVGPFGVDFVLVEPGPTATKFGANLDQAPPMPIYDATPSGDVRRMFAEGRFGTMEDADAAIDAMIATADADHPPLRLTLGAMALEDIERALAERLDAVRAQRAGADASRPAA